MRNETTAKQENCKCENTYCNKKATRRVKVSGTGGYAEYHYYCVTHAKKVMSN